MNRKKKEKKRRVGLSQEIVAIMFVRMKYISKLVRTTKIIVFYFILLFFLSSFKIIKQC